MGASTSSWKHFVTEAPGEYQWVVSTLRLDYPLFISKHINNVNSNVFNVKDCENTNIEGL